MTEWADLHAFVPYLTYPDWYQPKEARARRMDLTYRPPDIPATYFRYLSLPVVTRPLNGELAYRKVRAAVAQFHPDLILNYWLYPDGHAAVNLGRLLHKPVIVAALGSDIRRIDDPATRLLTRRVLARADHLITVSGELGQRAIADLGMTPERITTILNGFDETVFYPGDRTAERARLGLDPDAEIILFIGSLIPSKGLVELKDAVRALAAHRPRLQLVCGGEGPFRAALAAAGVVLPGKLSSAQVRTWMVASNLFCLPSHSEGCPNVVIEALACGRAVVASDVGGIPELVNSRNGILIPPRNAPALAEALNRALDTPWDDQAVAATYHRNWRDVAADTWNVCRRLLA
jgi:glycosyltransferase involved in cell wall biosynthesis